MFISTTLFRDNKFDNSLIFSKYNFYHYKKKKTLCVSGLLLLNNFELLNIEFDVNTQKHHKNPIFNVMEIESTTDEFRRLFTTGT